MNAMNADFELFGMPVELGTMLFQLVAFILLLLLLNKYAIKPLLGMMEKRQNQIEEDLRTAEQNRLETEKLIKEQNDALVAARQEAKEIVDRAVSFSEKEKATLLEAARLEAERIKDQAVAEIARERELAIVALKAEVAQLSVSLASKIIEKELDEQANQKLVDQYLQEVGGLQ